VIRSAEFCGTVILSCLGDANYYSFTSANICGSKIPSIRNTEFWALVPITSLNFNTISASSWHSFLLSANICGMSSLTRSVLFF
jgi:hypothetical protein